MKIQMIAARKVRINPRTRQLYETGKIYDVTDAVILQALDGAFEMISPSTAAELRPDQVAVLAAAADNIIVSAHAEAMAAFDSANLGEMKVADLKQLASVCGIAIEPSAKKADVIAALEAVRAANAQATSTDAVSMAKSV